jgi:hypothetical protein
MDCTNMPMELAPWVAMPPDDVTVTAPASCPVPPAPPIEAAPPTEKLFSQAPEEEAVAKADPPLPPLPPTDCARMPGAWLPAVVSAPVDCVTDTAPAVPPSPPPPPMDWAKIAGALCPLPAGAPR